MGKARRLKKEQKAFEKWQKSDLCSCETPDTPVVVINNKLRPSKTCANCGGNVKVKTIHKLR